MKTQSAKAKGRNLQKLLRDKILNAFPKLQPDDVTSRSMGAAGEDILLSPKARKYLNQCTFECKNLAKIAIYKHFEQATREGYQPVLVVKQNHSKPLAVIDLDYFIEIHKRLYAAEKEDYLC